MKKKLRTSFFTIALGFVTVLFFVFFVPLLNSLFRIVPNRPFPTFVPPSATAYPTTQVQSTFTSTPAEPIFDDFEVRSEEWIDYVGLGDGILRSGNGEIISAYCEPSMPISHTGSCSLKYEPAEIESDLYLQRSLDRADGSISAVSIFVYAPFSELCSRDVCSTASVVLTDITGKFYEGEPVPLNRVGEWVEIRFDLLNADSLRPYHSVGVHFHLFTPYIGSLYIDTMEIIRP